MSFLGNFLSGGKEAKKKTLIAEANAFADRLKTKRAFEIVDTNLLLNTGEHAFLQEATVLSETRAVRKSVGGFSGFRIAKGITIGGYRGTSESHQEWREMDNGQLVLTSKRLVFDGQKGNKVFALDKILSFHAYPDSISISPEGKSKDVNFKVRNPLIWGCVIQLLKNVENPLDLSKDTLNISFA